MPKKRTPAKSATKTPKPPLVPQPNGRGAIYAGGVPGNAGGTGRPPSALRELMREKLADRLPAIEAIADGEMTERASFPLLDILKHAHCPNCESELKPNDLEDALFVKIEGKTSPRAKDRISAVDIFARYGLGTTKEISVEDVKGRMAASIDAIRALPYPITSPDVILAAMRPFWTVTK